MDKRRFSSVILKYWYFLEFLGQPDFPAQDRFGKDESLKAAKGFSKRKQISVFNNLNYNCLFDGAENNTVQTPREILEFNDTVYIHHPAVSDEVRICIGKTEHFVFAEKLREICAPELEFPENNRHKVGLLGLKCDPKGYYIPGSLNISPLAWGVQRILKRQDESPLADLLSIDDYKRDMERLEKILLIEKDGKAEGELLIPTLIKALIRQIYQEYPSAICPSSDSVCWDGVLVSQRYQTEEIKADDTETYRESELFRSFFASDILMVSEAIGKSKFGGTPMQSALMDYICTPYSEENPQSGRSEIPERADVFGWSEQDLSEQMDFFHKHFDISRAPHGKWPSRYSPGLMQQLAVNLSWKPSCDNQTIFSVNGPPGTGKTTLLKEIIAGNVVERAYLLTQYDMPDDAFEERHFHDGLEKNNGYSRFCNAYFAFKNDALKDYGMLVASCNNAAVENITKELPDANKLLKEMTADEKDDSTFVQGLKDVADLFRTDLAETEVYQTWNTASSKYEPCDMPDIFFTKLANDLAEKPVGKWNQWGLISAPFGKSSNLKNYIYRVLKPYIKSFGRNDFIETKREEYKEAAKRFSEQYNKVKSLESELKTFSGARAELLKRERELERKVNNAQTQLDTAKRENDVLRQETEELERALLSAKEKLNNYCQTARTLKSQMIAEQAEYDRLGTEIEAVQQQIIALEKSRSLVDYVFKLFHKSNMLLDKISEKYAALEKLKIFSDKQRVIAKKAAEEYNKQQKNCLLHEKKIQQINNDKQTLAVRQEQNRVKQQRLLKTIEDCNKAVSAELDKYKALMSSANGMDAAHQMTVLDEEFFELYNSKDDAESCRAQNENPWQTSEYNRERETYYTDGPEDLWVGCPLVVHRRCISPMFDISNAVSYNNIMKQQTALPSPEKEKTFCNEKSGWINVCGSERSTSGKDHFVETQGKKAWEMILSAFRKTDGSPSMFVITPFTTVRDGFIKMVSEQSEYKRDKRIREWTESCIGTVHTFQGKEADQVIFLLGCDEKSVSAVKWVNTNIVNVAVTRAKYRLYVIGDYLVWRESPIFQKVKGILDSYA